MRRAPRRLSTQIYLLCLVTAVVVPLLAFAGFLLSRYAATERARFERAAERMAYQMAMVVDGELAGQAALLAGLASSSALARDDLAAYYHEARRLVDGKDAVIVLRDLETRQFFNTQRPFGADLPPAVPLTHEERTQFRAGRPLVSAVYLSPVSGEPRIAVALPIMRAGVPAYVLAITVPTSRIHQALMPAVPQGWIVGIGDRNGTYVTRSIRHHDVTGQPGLPEYLAKAVGRSGTFTAPNIDGVMLLAGYHRSDFSGWLFGANVPLDVVAAPLRRSLTLFAAVGGAALALSALLAYLFGAGVVRATAGLAQRAAALGHGQPLPPLESRLSEFTLVADAQDTAAEAVAERASEREKAAEREALLGSIFDAAGLCIGIVELLADDYRYVVANRGTAALLGRADSGVDGMLASALGLSAGEIRFWLDLCRQVDAGGVSVTVERAFTQEGAARGWYLFTLTPLPAGAGGSPRIAFTAVDITARKRTEEQRQLLINELNHRVKNTLATVQSIAAQTLRGTGSMIEARDAFTDRLIALAKAHDVLTRESWEGAELHDIITDATGPHGGRDRFHVSGPPVWLSPTLSLSLSLALHELATNAAKYGALSNETGTVTVSWEVSDPVGAPRLALRWAESGGPPVQPPTRQGFGSRLIRGLSAEIGASATVDYAPDGLVCVLTAPVRRRSEPMAALAVD
jgi:two-component sensor histidine kinase